jgi:hypothetical protein
MQKRDPSAEQRNADSLDQMHGSGATVMMQSVGHKAAGFAIKRSVFRIKA